MSIITISRGSSSKGQEVAEKVAHKLGYECIARKIILEASEEFNIPETHLERALHDSPSFFNRFTYGKERYAAYIRYNLLKYLQNDNVVYHGLAGHFFLQGVPHVLKIRIIADMDIRIKEVLKREKISEEEARKLIVKDDDERRKWSLHLYKIDTWDPSLYDMVLHIGQMKVDEAVEIIADTSQKTSFVTTPESQRKLDDYVLAARVQTLLIEEFPTVKTRARDKEVFVSCEGPISQKQNMVDKINRIMSETVDLKNLTVHVSPILVYD